jgi:DNA modification methylase
MNPSTVKPAKDKTGGINALQPEDSPVHGWYRFVLSYPPHLVRQYLNRFGLTSDNCVLDPFCGTGTTLVEAKKNSIPSVGCDAHPFAALASRVKTHWRLDATLLRRKLSEILKNAEGTMSEYSLPLLSLHAHLIREGSDPAKTSVKSYSLDEHENKILPGGFVSERPLQRLLILRDEIEQSTSQEKVDVREFFLLALGHVVANGAGNFAFGPEIYRTKPKEDYDVLGHFACHSNLMMSELAAVQAVMDKDTSSKVFQSDARSLKDIPDGIAAVITSPPYPNEKDYTRTTRVESLLLRLVSDRESLRSIKELLLRSNTRNIFVNDRDGDDVKEFASIQRICGDIEKRRLELGKTSGFERLYHKVVAHYFGGMRRHFRSLRPKLKPGARLAYVVGDQFSFLMVPVPTAALLGEVAEAEGLRVIGCDLWRERIGTKVKNDTEKRRTVRVREEVLLLEKT